MPRVIENGGDLGIPEARSTRYMSIAATIVIEPSTRGKPPLPVTRELAEFTA
jgi:hypothetical protein